MAQPDISRPTGVAKTIQWLGGQISVFPFSYAFLGHPRAARPTGSNTSGIAHAIPIIDPRTSTLLGTEREMAKNIFIVGVDDFNLHKLQTLRDAHEYRFHDLITQDQAKDIDHLTIKDLLHMCQEKIDASTSSVDAIVGYWDFPVSDLVPLLCRRYQLPAPPLESILKCEHKYWSRLIQRQVAPDIVPDFVGFNPFHVRDASDVPLDYPFWIKPVKSLGSHLGFRINSEQDWHHALPIIRDNIGRMGAPFNYILSHVEVPPEVSPIDGYHCIAEELTYGRQCTLEGYVHDGSLETYGIVDSFREPNRSSFSRYQYPSRLPAKVQRQIAQASKNVIHALGLDNSPLNFEFFYNEQQKRLHLLEINPRISQSHSDLFEKVDGASNHEVMVHLALGQKPRFPLRQGRFHIAAKCFIRAYEDGEVVSVPSAGHIREVERAIPGALVHLHVSPGMRLSHLKNQDSYSFELGYIFIGARSQHELLLYRHQALEMLPFGIAARP